MSTSTLGTAAANPLGSSATSGTGATGGTGANASVMQTLNANDFLTLMTAQLKNQDPLNPTDSNQFLSQLAQLSTVTGISSLNSTMSNLSTSLISSQALTSVALVGKSVLTSASSATYRSGAPISGAVQVPANASSLTLNVTDSSGMLVNQFSVAPGTGLQGFTWNGTTSTGAAAPPGTYNFSASVTVGGSSQAAATLLDGTVRA